MLSKRKPRRRMRRHGFLGRSASVLKSRRQKGRRSLTVSNHSKR